MVVSKLFVIGIAIIGARAEQISHNHEVQRSLMQRASGAIARGNSSLRGAENLGETDRMLSGALLDKKSKTLARDTIRNATNPKISNNDASNKAKSYFNTTKAFLAKKQVTTGPNGADLEGILLDVLVAKGGDVELATKCVKQHSGVWHKFTKAELENLYKNNVVDCKTQMEVAMEVNAKVAPFRATKQEKEMGNKYELDTSYMAEAMDMTSKGVHIYAEVMVDLLKCYHKHVDNKYKDAGLTFEIWLNNGKETDCSDRVGNGNGLRQTKKKSDLKEKLIYHSVLYFTPEQQVKFTPTIQNGRIHIPALGDIGPQCPDMSVVVTAQAYHKHGMSQMCDGMAGAGQGGKDWPMDCVNFQYTGKDFPRTDCLAETSLTFVMRNTGHKDEVHMGAHHTGVFHHSSLWAGKPCKTAGTVRFKKNEADPNGPLIVTMIDATTGHYKTPRSTLTHMVTWLLNNGFGDKKWWCGNAGIQCASFNQADPKLCREEFPEAFQGHPAC
mmetsp:Transcript_4098/g.7578  ORF Transcript_4098/g.7578 Transcript_4098/m.7578 type:complete len:498 (-) Transcript_4098:195-1688(-)